MKFIIEVDDFFIDAEREIVPEMKKQIIHEIVQQVREKFKEQINEQITKRVIDEVAKHCIPEINKLTAEAVKEGVFFIDSQKTKTMKITDYVNNAFSERGGWRSPQEAVTEYCKEFANELKKRYDFAFAAQVVNKLSEHGMLKDEQILKLLDKTAR